jgi:hypothetical protein
MNIWKWNQRISYILFILFYLVLLSGCEVKKNNTALFFDGVEIQYETEEQGKVIIEALNDMLTLDEEELNNKLYPDCCKTGKTVRIGGVIYSHFVPDSSGKVLNDDFYKELKTEEVREQIEKLLETMEKYIYGDEAG